MTDTAQPVRWEDQQRWWEQYERENPPAEKLRAHLSFMVPLRIMELRQQGGPSAEDYERVRGYVCHPGFFYEESPTSAFGGGEDPPACVGPPPPEGAPEAGNTLLCHGARRCCFPRVRVVPVGARCRRCRRVLASFWGNPAGLGWVCIRCWHALRAAGKRGQCP